jgi:NAD(P)H dehydrogenase (quinone)
MSPPAMFGLGTAEATFLSLEVLESDTPFRADVRDTGAVGARILIDPAPHVGKTSEFTGANTNDGAFTDVFSQVLGRKITYLEVTPEQNEQAMKARGMPDWLVAHLAAIARIVRSGGASTENTKPIYDIVKRAPLTTKQFVEDHKAFFA